MLKNKKVLIFSDDLASLKKKIDITRQDFRFISLEDTASTVEISEFLSRETPYEEIDRTKLLQENREDLRQKYIEFIGRLNVANASREWWALDMSTKSMLVTGLGQRIIYSKLISMIINNDDVGGLIILSSDRELAHQIRSWASAQGITYSHSLKGRSKIRSLTVDIPVYIPFYFFRTIFQMLRAKRTLGDPLTGKNYTALLSLINYQSFDKNGRYQDTYFGDLAERLRERGENVLVFGKILDGFDKNVSAIQGSGEQTVLPMEYFLTVGDVIQCAVSSIKGFLKAGGIRGETLFDGIDVKYLLLRQKKLDLSRRYFVNLADYYSTRRLISKIKLKVFLYPFENRAFEKMCLSAIKESGIDLCAVGYNHTPVTPKHTNLSLISDEVGVVPLPDRVITIGQVTGEILRTSLGLSPERVQTGCALRQKNVQAPDLIKKPQKIIDIFVGLTGELEDYIGVLLFIQKAFRNDPKGYHFLLRPHPIMPLAPALEIVGELGLSYEDTFDRPLVDVLKRSHLALNTSSAVGIEAATRGIPVIYIDYGDVMVSDPLSELKQLKWTAREPTDLVAIIKEIDSIDNKKFEEEQRAEADFANNYLIPATPENLSNFIDLLEIGN